MTNAAGCRLPDPLFQMMAEERGAVDRDLKRQNGKEDADVTRVMLKGSVNEALRPP